LLGNLVGGDMIADEANYYVACLFSLYRIAAQVQTPDSILLTIYHLVNDKYPTLSHLRQHKSLPTLRKVGIVM